MSVRALAWAWKQACPTPLAKLVLVRLAFYATEDNEAWPSFRRIAEECGTTREAVSRVIRALIAVGLLCRQRRNNGDGGNAPNLYTLPVDEKSTAPVDEKSTPVDLAVDEKSTPLLISDQPEIQVRNTSKNPPTPPRGNGAPLKAEFTEWWLAYPHKVGKGAAEQKFAIARRSAALTELLDGIRRYVASKPDDRPWCNPATWLHQRRWEDQPATSLLDPQGGVMNGTAPHGPAPRVKDLWPGDDPLSGHQDRA